MEADKWLFDIYATESSTKDAIFNVLPHQLHWFFTNFWEFDTSQLEKLWTATEQAAGGSIMVGHQDQTMICLHMIALYFWLFWGGICVATVERLIPNITGHDPVFPAGHHGFKLRCADSHLSLFRLSCRPSQCTLDRLNQMKPKKNMIQTRFFFCSAPSNEVIKHLSQDQKTGWQECCLVEETVSLQWSSADGSYSFWIVERKSGDGMLQINNEKWGSTQHYRSFRISCWISFTCCLWAFCTTSLTSIKETVNVSLESSGSASSTKGVSVSGSS